MKRQEIIDVLTNYGRYKGNVRYGIFMDGKQLFMSASNVYMSEGIAKKKMVDQLVGQRNTKAVKEQIKEQIEQLIKEGIIEIKQI